MKKIFPLVGLLLLMACSKEQAIIMQEEIEPINKTSIELVEETQEDENENLQYLEFTLYDQLITLNINNIPVILNYLKQHSNKEKALQEMELRQIMSNHFDTIFLLSFACQDYGCSYLLINTETAESQLLADQAQVAKIEPSPNLDYLLIIFRRQFAHKPMDAHKLMVFDTDQWDNVILRDQDDELISLYSFRWPIIDTVWLHDSLLKITLPDIDQPNSVLIDEWETSELHQIKEIIAEIE